MMGTSFVQALPSTAGPQPPHFYVTHWMGEPVIGFIQCLEQARHDYRVNCDDDHDRRGGGMTADTPVWVRTCGINLWDLSYIPDDPKGSGFVKAMNIAKGRTISI